eukprot:1791152-Ditylum_brightwellii.AAC.1
MQLYANTETAPTTLGGGTHGHAGLTMCDVLYQMVASSTYTTPTKPMRTTLRTGMATSEHETT